jgi:hypothetical protein
MRSFRGLCLNEHFNQKYEIASLPPCPFLSREKKETTLPSFNPEGSTSTNKLLQDKKIDEIRKNICAQLTKIKKCLELIHILAFHI